MFPLINDLKIALQILNDNGFEAYLVGGAIRDYYFNVKTNDYDVTTNANTDEIIDVFKDYKTKLYSSKKTVLVKIGETHIEITPFKGDNLISDLKLRDYTINSIAVDINSNIYDPLNGRLDINNKILRPSYNLSDMISIDPLRILRGIRLISVYNLSYDNELKDYFINNVSLLNEVIDSRFRDELDKILVSNKPSNVIREFKEVFYYFFPNLRNCYKFDQRNTKWHHLDVFEHILLVLDSTKPNLATRYAALFHDIDKPLSFTLDSDNVGHFYGHFKLSRDTAVKYLFNLHYPKKFITLVAKLIYYHDRRFSFENESIDNFIEDFGDDEEELKMIFDLMASDIKGQNPKLLSRLNDLDKYLKVALDIARLRRER